MVLWHLDLKFLSGLLQCSAKIASHVFKIAHIEKKSAPRCQSAIHLKQIAFRIIG